jgi:hypothetical protein
MLRKTTRIPQWHLMFATRTRRTKATTRMQTSSTINITTKATLKAMPRATDKATATTLTRYVIAA